MKVFVVWSIPEYIGIDIEGVFLLEEDAVRMVENHNSSAPEYDLWDYSEYEVQ